MSKDNIIGRIRKLLAIADKNSGASENEMMTEMSMAQALMSGMVQAASVAACSSPLFDDACLLGRCPKTKFYGSPAFGRVRAPTPFREALSFYFRGDDAVVTVRRRPNIPD